MSTPRSITVLAPAKLNLALSVGPPEADGMHPISSWMVTVDFFDELTLTALEPDRFSRYAIQWHEEARCRCDIDWSITDDLAVRAHLALEDHCGQKLPVQLRLDKRIPVGGGLGGGSSNAAAMLRGVNELYELGFSRDELATIGAGLGSDVPFLVHGGSAVVGGRGDAIDVQPTLPEVHSVLVLPTFPCATGTVYRLFDEQAGAALRADAVEALAGGVRGPLRPDAVFNDLTRPAIRTAPALETLLADVSAVAERPAHLAGSGSSLFVICDDELHAGALAEAIEQRLNLAALPVRTHEMAHASC